MKRYTLYALSVIFLLSGCSSAFPGNETEPETLALGDEIVTFDTELPVLKIDDVEFPIGQIPSDDMLAYIEPFYKSHDQYHVDIDMELQSAGTWRNYMNQFMEDVQKAAEESSIAEEGGYIASTEEAGEDEAIMVSPNISDEELQNAATRVVFGGQRDDGSYLSFSVSNLSSRNMVAANCTITNTSLIYGDSLGTVTYDDKEIKTRADMEALMGRDYSTKDSSEYDYIYDSMCVYTIDGYMTMTFLMSDDNVVGVQQADLGEYANLFGGR